MRLGSILQQNGLFENAVFSLYGADSIWDNGFPVQMPVFSLNGRNPGKRGFPWLDFRLLGELRRMLHEFEPDLVLAHGGDTFNYGAVVKFLSRKPGMARVVYKNIGTASFWVRPGPRSILNRLLVKGFDAVVSVSQYTRRDFMNLYRLPEAKVSYIPNGVVPDEFDTSNQSQTRFQVRREFGLPERDLVLISVGNLSEEKGHGTLLEVSGALVRDGLDNRLLIVGDGPLRQALEEQARQPELAGRVHFLGRRSDVPRLLAAADIFVLSSKTEGMPGVLVEAGFAGLPSVAFAVGGVAEVVEHGITGLLAPPGDLTGFASALADLHQDHDARARMGSAARQRCRDLFDIRQVAQQYEELFLNILGVSPKDREWAIARK